RLPVVALAPRDGSYERMLGNIEEVRARDGHVIAVVHAGDRAVASKAQHVIEVPACADLLAPLITVIPLQLLAYHIAVRLGCAGAARGTAAGTGRRASRPSGRPGAPGGAPRPPGLVLPRLRIGEPPIARYNRPGPAELKRLLDDLNPPQREAVTAGDGPLLVLA